MNIFCAYNKLEKTERLISNPKNPNTHPDKQIELLAKIIDAQGWRAPITVSKRSGFVIRGHGRLEAAKLLNYDKVPIDYQDYENEAMEWADMIADNKIAEMAEIDDELLKTLLTDLKDIDFDIELSSFTVDDIDFMLKIDKYKYDESTAGILSNKFGVPPFSILDTRSGDWQKRKKIWLELGIDSNAGRGEDILSSGLNKLSKAKKTGLNGTSLFDPVLCELMYTWFNIKNGLILDPFAGGSVRGIVAAKLGYNYTGIDLRQEQIDANIEQASKLNLSIPPTWLVGNSINIKNLVDNQLYDFIFSCPPYHDLEVYSENTEDLSNMNYNEFIVAYKSIIKNSIELLKNGRFAVFVVGEIRDKKGAYKNFVSDTIKAFTDSGAFFYNEIILVNMLGTLPIRAGSIFNSSRKIGKTHQNVLVFYKGDIKNIKKYFGEIDIRVTE